MPGTTPSGPRCAAIVGPYLSGKTTLLEALLHVCDAIPRMGSVKEGNRVGDASDEARQRDMSVELNAATAEYLGESWHFIDCPGSVEYVGEAKAGLMAADVAVVVCDPESAKAMALSSMFSSMSSLSDSITGPRNTRNTSARLLDKPIRTMSLAPSCRIVFSVDGASPSSSHSGSISVPRVSR